MSSKQVTLVDQYFKYINTTTGRDKLNRTLQHTFKFLLNYNLRHNGTEETIKWLQNLIKNIQLSRKFVRLGKPAEHVKTFIKTLSLKDDFSKYCILGRNAAYSIYLTFDMMIWFHKSGVKKINNIKDVQKNSQRFWLIGIIFGIMNEIYKLRKTLEKIGSTKKCIMDVKTSAAAASVKTEDEETVDEKENEKLKAKTEELDLLLYKKKNHYLTLTQHFCDFIHPITSLGYTKIPAIYLNVAGITSSVLGARAQWIKVNGKK